MLARPLKDYYTSYLKLYRALTSRRGRDKRIPIRYKG